jgi:hypothetical protein
MAQLVLVVLDAGIGLARVTRTGHFVEAVAGNSADWVVGNFAQALVGPEQSSLDLQRISTVVA